MPSPIRRLPPFAVGCAVVALTTALTGPAWADPAPSFRTLLERIGASPSAAEADAFLTRRGLVLRRVEAYGLPQALRLTVGPEEANRLVVEALAAFMSGRTDA